MCVCGLPPTWPLDLIGVPQVFWGREKHLCIGDRRPKRNHVESPIVPDRSVLLRVNYFTCRMSQEKVSLYIHSSSRVGHISGSARTCSVPGKPLVKDGIGERVQQDKDGVVGREVSLSARPVEEKVSQVVEAADHGVVHPLGGAVALTIQNNKGV